MSGLHGSAATQATPLHGLQQRDFSVTLPSSQYCDVTSLMFGRYSFPGATAMALHGSLPDTRVHACSSRSCRLHMLGVT